MLKDKLIEIRKENNDTQELLGNKINVSRSLIAKWEQGRAYPSYEQIEQISNLYNQPVEYLLSKNELKEIYGFYKKNSNIKKAVIIGSVALVALLIPFSVIGINFMTTYRTEGYENIKFNKIQVEDNGYSLFDSSGEKISINKNQVTDFIYLGDYHDRDININCMNNGGQAEKHYSRDAFGHSNDTYEITLNSPIYEDKDYTNCVFFDLKHEFGSGDEQFDVNNCFYFKKIFKEDSFGGMMSSFETNASTWYVEDATYGKDWVKSTVYFEFHLDSSRFLELHDGKALVDINANYIFENGDVSRYRRNCLYEDRDYNDLNPGTTRTGIHATYDATHHYWSYSYISSCNGFFTGSFIMKDPKYKNHYMDFTFNVRFSSFEEYRISEFDSEANLLKTTRIETIEDFNNYVPQPNVSCAYVESYFFNNSENSIYKTEDVITVEIPSESGVYVTLTKNLK